jgi:hypothetical protein
MTRLDAELDAVLKAMESSFHVRLIGTFAPDLIWAPVDAVAAPWLEKNNPDFSQFPVKQGEATVGILLRGGNHEDKTVGEAMQALSEGLIVSADMPIADLIPQLRETHHRLVLRGGRIDGLVTQSDLLKLPVRLLVFAFIAHLEQVMTDVIRTRWPGDSWIGALSEGRQLKINKKEGELRCRDMNPPKIELTEFCDKRDLCKQLMDGGKSRFEEDLDDLRGLRDQIAHASTFVDHSEGKTGVAAFVDKFESAKRWIDELTRLTAKSKATK